MLGTLLLAVALAAPPAPPAFVRFESGRHTGSVRGVARDPISGDWITVGFDKAVRRWHEGRPAGPPLRFMTGDADDGVFASCDVSATGLLAVGDGDRDGPSIWLYDLTKGEGQKVRRLRTKVLDTTSATAFTSVAFSADGRRVAAGDNAGAVTVWETTGTPVGVRRVAPGTAYSVFGVAFAPSGNRLAYAAAHNDGARAEDQKGYVGVVDAGGKSLADAGKPMALDHRAMCLDWHDPNAIAVGGSRGRLDLWTPGSAGATRVKTGLDDPRQEVLAVARSADGKTMVAGTILGDLLVYRNGAADPQTIHPGSPNVKATALRLSPDAQRVVSTQNDGAVVETPLGGGESRVLSPAAPAVKGLQWASDGTALKWNVGDGARGFSLARSEPDLPRQLAETDGTRLGSVAVTVENGRATVEGASGWKELIDPARIDEAVVLDEGHILVATAQGLHIHAPNRNAPVTADGDRPTSLARSPDGTKVAVGFADGVVRIYSSKNLDTAWPLAAVYVGEGEWVAWQETTGLYDSSVGGDAIFGFQVNPPTDDKLASFVPAAVAEKTYRRPGLLPGLVGLQGGTHSAPPTVSLATAVTQAPAFHVVGVEGGSETSDGWTVPGDAATVIVDVRNQTTGDKVAVRIGQGTSRDVDISAFVDVPNPDGATKKCNVAGLVPGRNLARIFVNGKAIPGSEFALVCKKPVTTPERLIVLAIGIGKYSDPKMAQANLDSPVKDATAFVETVQGNAVGAKLLVLPPLYDEEATRAAILAALDALKAESKPSDRVLVFMASHGVRKDEATYVTPHDFSPKDPKGTGLAWPDLAARLSAIDCRSLVLFTDNCHSGAAIDGFTQKAKTSATNEMRDLQNAVSVFAACDATQESQEYADLGHGLFTYALLKGLQGQIPGQGFDRDTGLITVDSLREAIPRYMAKLHDEGQTPRIMSPDATIPVTRAHSGGR